MIKLPTAGLTPDTGEGTRFAVSKPYRRHPSMDVVISVVGICSDEWGHSSGELRISVPALAG